MKNVKYLLFAWAPEFLMIIYMPTYLCDWVYKTLSVKTPCGSDDAERVLGEEYQ